MVNCWISVVNGSLLTVIAACEYTEDGVPFFDEDAAGVWVETGDYGVVVGGVFGRAWVGEGEACCQAGRSQEGGWFHGCEVLALCL